jgi:uncharacterized protein
MQPSSLIRLAPWFTEPGAARGAPPDPGVAAFSTLGEGALAPCAIGPESIVAGQPQARASVEATSPDGRLATGLWDCTAGVLDIAFRCDEFVHIVEGEVLVRCNGQTHHLMAGHVAYFPKGVVALWEIPEYVKKAYVHRYPPRPSRLRRALAKLGRMTGLAR